MMFVVLNTTQRCPQGKKMLHPVPRGIATLELPLFSAATLDGLIKFFSVFLVVVIVLAVCDQNRTYHGVA